MHSLRFLAGDFDVMIFHHPVLLSPAPITFQYHNVKSFRLKAQRNQCKYLFSLDGFEVPPVINYYYYQINSTQIKQTPDQQQQKTKNTAK